MPPPKVVQVEPGEAHKYLAKAEQFCASAGTELVAGHYDSGVLLAVHAGISAADAFCVGLGRRRSSDPDHMRAADLVESVGSNTQPARERASTLRALINVKNRVEYESKRAGRDDADNAIKRCARLVSWAKEEISRAGI